MYTCVLPVYMHGGVSTRVLVPVHIHVRITSCVYLCPHSPPVVLRHAVCNVEYKFLPHVF